MCKPCLSQNSIIAMFISVELFPLKQSTRQSYTTVVHFISFLDRNMKQPLLGIASTWQVQLRSTVAILEIQTA